ncbi:SOS response-associated peptidase [Craurococcus roseus]|uniref:Abasic site processing protein n=2 Tax=Craurococcus roseus TaxID=77585 RepID=A0ABN1FL24_9PROT
MCGRYVQTMPAEAVRQLFRTGGALPNLAPSWNVAPTQSAPVVRRHPDTGERHLDLLRWGLRPRWVKDAKGAREPINARAETVATSPMFRQAYAKRRCLVPADAFFEWKAEPGGKQPMAIAPASGDGMAFAGLWEHWRGEGDEVVRTFAIVTTDANAPMRAVHGRMPVILAEDDWAAWLECDDPARLLRPAPDDLLRFWPVSKAVNSPRNNGPELLGERPQAPAGGGGPNAA